MRDVAGFDYPHYLWHGLINMARRCVCEPGGGIYWDCPLSYDNGGHLRGETWGLTAEESEDGETAFGVVPLFHLLTEIEKRRARRLARRNSR